MVADISTEGVKIFLKTIVETAFPAANVYTDMNEDTPVLRNLPAIGIRINFSPYDNIFGRQVTTSQEGDFEVSNFTLACFTSNCNVSGSSKSKYVTDMTDTIKKYMKQNHTAFKVSDEIHDIYNVESREFLKGELKAYAVSGTVITGSLLVRKID